MSSRSASAFWALVLVVVGAIFLLQNFDILPGNAWNTIWPVLLILLGAWLLLGNFARRGGQAASSHSIPLDGAREAHIRVDHGAGQLRIGPGSEAGTLLSTTFDGELDHDVRRSGDRVDVRLRLNRDWTFWMWPGNWGTSFHWSMALQRETPLAMEIHTGASTADIDLRELKVRDVRLETGASTVDLRLPASGQVTGRIKAGSATLRVHVPDGVGLRVRGSIGAATLNVRGNRFGWGSDAYQSPDFETNPNRVDLDVEGGAATIDVF